MTQSPGNPNPSVTLDEVIGLNDEIISLVRSGVPLGDGLQQFADDHRNSLGRVSANMASRLSRGESLSHVLAASDVPLPTTYRMVVEAGLRSGRLTAALECLAEFGRELNDLRRRIGMALLYPLIVTAIAYGLFVVVFLPVVAQLFYRVFQDFNLPTPSVLTWLHDVAPTILKWGWVPPIAGLLLVIWWMCTKSSQLLEFRGITKPLEWIPGVRRLARDFRSANFAKLTALLLEHDVPMHEAVKLAARASVDEATQNAVYAIAESANRGELNVVHPAQASKLPPFLRWLMLRPSEQAGLCAALRSASDMYRRRALVRSQWMKFVFPALMAVVIGGGVTLVYALLLFYPFTEMLNGLSFL